MQLAILLGFVGPWQIALIVVVLLLLFGGKKIPELMRGLGTGMKEFKDATREDEPSSQNPGHSSSNSDSARSAENHSTHADKK